MTRRIPKGTIAHEPLTWALLHIGGGGKSATFSCPKGHWGTLEDHTIAADGTVSPSVLCMRDCDFHEYIVLDGWVP